MSEWWWWSWVLTAVGVTGLYLAGRKIWWAWLVGLGAQVLWIAYATATSQSGFFLSAAVYSDWDREAEVAYEAAEPIIRADEREEFCDCPAAFARYKATHEAEVRERLRAQVKALEIPLVWNRGEDALIFRSQVLALLGGESE